MLDPVTLTALGDLELVARLTVEGTMSGLHRSPFHGYSAEFTQYRHYRPGDDLKYVDWKLLARTDRVYTKQYRETTNLNAQIVLDASASMAYAGRGGVSKLQYARLMAAALAHLLGAQGDAVGLVAYAEGVREYLAPRTGRAHVRRLLVALDALEGRGATATPAALRRAVDLLKRRGLLMLFSDLYDEDGAIEAELRRAVRMGHELAVFLMLTRDELEFPFRGDVRLEDVESGRTVLSGSAVAERYRANVRAFVARWRERCAVEGIDFALAATDRPIDTALREYLLARARRGPQ